MIRETTSVFGALALAAVLAVPQIPLTPEQRARLYSDTLLLRVCPSEPDPYAIEEKGGDCIGGQSGSPSQSGAGGG